MDNIMIIIKCGICRKDITCEDHIEIRASDVRYFGGEKRISDKEASAAIIFGDKNFNLDAYVDQKVKKSNEARIYRHLCPKCFAKLDEFLTNLQTCTAQDQPDFYNPKG